MSNRSRVKLFFGNIYHELQIDMSWDDWSKHCLLHVRLFTYIFMHKKKNSLNSCIAHRHEGHDNAHSTNFSNGCCLSYFCIYN